MSCLSQPLEDAGKGSVQIEEGTNETKGSDKITRKGAVEQSGSRPASQKHEARHAAYPQGAAVFYGLDGGLADGVIVSQGVIF